MLKQHFEQSEQILQKTLPSVSQSKIRSQPTKFSRHSRPHPQQKQSPLPTNGIIKLQPQLSSIASSPSSSKQSFFNKQGMLQFMIIIFGLLFLMFVVKLCFKKLDRKMRIVNQGGTSFNKTGVIRNSTKKTNHKRGTPLKGTAMRVAHFQDEDQVTDQEDN